MYEFDNSRAEYSHWSSSTFDDRRNEFKSQFDASFRTFSIISIVIGTFFGVIFIFIFCYIINRIIRMHNNPFQASAGANRIRTTIPVNNTENTIGTVAAAPPIISFTPNRNNRQYLPLNNERVDQYARPIGFDVGIDLDRSFRSAQDNRSFSLNNVGVDQYTRPMGFDVGIDLDRSYRSAQDNRSLPRKSDVQMLSSDKPPAYSTVVSHDLSGDTFPSVSLRVPAESSLPSYEERSICKR